MRIDELEQEMTSIRIAQRHLEEGFVFNYQGAYLVFKTAKTWQPFDRVNPNAAQALHRAVETMLPTIKAQVERELAEMERVIANKLTAACKKISDRLNTTDRENYASDRARTLREILLGQVP